MAEKATKAPFDPKRWCRMGCGTSIGEKEIACPKCLKKIPKEIKARINEAFRTRDGFGLQEAYADARGAVLSKRAS